MRSYLEKTHHKKGPQKQTTSKQNNHKLESSGKTNAKEELMHQWELRK
jgi:hypothetical protein